jgi:hypothetical protein
MKLKTLLLTPALPHRTQAEFYSTGNDALANQGQDRQNYRRRSAGY